MYIFPHFFAHLKSPVNARDVHGFHPSTIKIKASGSLRDYPVYVFNPRPFKATYTYFFPVTETILSEGGNNDSVVKVLAALSEDPGSLFSIHMAGHKHLNYRPGELLLSSDFCEHCI